MPVAVPADSVAAPSEAVACPACQVPLTPRPATGVAVRRVTSQGLLNGGRELVIQHHGSEYHLRLTRNDKLILTK